MRRPPKLGIALAVAFSLLTTPGILAQTFTDVTTAAGITHVQTTSHVEQTTTGLMNFMTGGVAASDFDGDGLTDLLFTRLNDLDIYYRNLGNGTFESRTTTAGFSTATLTNGVVSGDVDNDGDLDVYMTTTNDTRNYLYLNDGAGFFTDAGTTRTAALANGVIRYGQGASFGDYDNDGYLDLVTTDYETPAADNQSRLLRNRGVAQPGFFDDVTVAAGVNVFPEDRSYRFSPRLVDLDRDGHLDLAIAADFGTSQLFWNNGNGSFTDGTIPAGIGTEKHGMGSTFGDYDGDGDLDWFVTSVGELEGNRLYSNHGDRTFTDVTQEAGVNDSWWSWGTSFFDYDNDGDLDLIATNGFYMKFIDDRTSLWRNEGGVFTDVSDSVGIVDTAQGRGLAHLDYDSDGDLDIVIVNNQAQPILYRNDSGNDNDYLRIEVEGTVSNRDGIGAFITVTPDLGDLQRRMVWEVDGGSSFLSQNEQIAHFGLGQSDGTVDLVTIEWTSGVVDYLHNISANQTLTVVEAQTVPEPPSLVLAGDYSGNGTVDAADYTIFRDNLGGDSAVLNGNGSGAATVVQADSALWKQNFASSDTGSSTAVPEPSAVCLLILGAVHCRIASGLFR